MRLILILSLFSFLLLLSCNSSQKELTPIQKDSLELLRTDKKATDEFLSYFNTRRASKNETDLDGDGKKDEINFAYTGGAHCS